LNICDNDSHPNDLFTTFDLTVKDATITQGLLGYTVTYYPSFPVTPTSVAIATPIAYINAIPAVQTLGVMVTSAQGCKSYTTLDIRVLPIPVPRTNPPALAAQCDDNNPGDLQEVFDLTVNAAYIINGDPNVVLHYFATQGDAMANQNELIPANASLVGQNVWIRVENNRVDYQGNNCYVLVEQALTVNPLPTVVQTPTLLPFYSCDNDADGISTFDLQNQIANLLGATQSTTGYTVSFYATAQGANPFTNTGETALALTNYQNVIPFQEDVYVRIVNNSTGCVNATGVLRLIVEQAAVANPVIFTPVCDTYGDTHDGVFQIDLTSASISNAVLLAQDPTIFLLSYYHTLAEANAAVPGTEISNPATYETAADDDTVYIRVTNSATTSPCYAVTPLVIHIERYPDPTIVTQNGVNTICVDYTDDTNVLRDLLLEITNPIAGNYTYQWFENGTAITGETNPTYLVSLAATAGATRTYTVEMTSVALGCPTLSPTFDVIQSGPAVIPTGTIGYTVTNAFEQNQIITVNVEGFGTYQYSLDDGPRQDSNVFEDVTLGTHTITVWDSEGGLIYSCDSLIIEDVQIIDYPHYFTPNGDGIHDTWNIVGLAGQPTAKIYIFDRYGKLLKQISSTGAGWDGIYNGKLLPSTDYWFTVDFVEGLTFRQFKAHFAMKR
jgi:gliding motility-associated-like protein